MKPDSKNNQNINDDNITLTSRDEVKLINIALTQQASKSIDIISKYLDPGVFDTPDFIEALKQLAISSKFTKIRILIKDSNPMVRNGHRMIKIIQQFTSNIEVRKSSEKYKSYNEAFSVFDKKGVVYLRYADRYDGFANYNNPRLVSGLSGFFNEVWERSISDENLRRVHL